PKPDGSKPGLTSGPDGTFDPTTKKFTIEWTTTIVGGPFNNFTGKWHFEGVYEGTLPAAFTAPTTSGGATSDGSTTTGSAGSGSATSPSGGSTTSGATTPAATTAAVARSTASGAAMASTGLRLAPTLPAVLIGLGLISRRLGRRPRARR
ncbi:MAG TPA: hypothetical protein VG034_07490, partial [Acidimicrobiia bacterium]|nr:hypothetical protein [Acidimicrobiia bacterium]